MAVLANVVWTQPVITTQGVYGTQCFSATKTSFVAAAVRYGDAGRDIRDPSGAWRGRALGARRTRRAAEHAAARSGVSRDLLRGLERASRSVNLTQGLDVLSSFGVDVVLVPRDRLISLRDPRDVPGATEMP